MELWVIVTFAAAAFQTVRFMLQKHLSAAALTVTGATFSRYIYSAPLILLALWGLLHLRGEPMPAIGGKFWPNVLAGAFAQVVATICVVAVFKMRNFAVGVTLMKTEVLMTVIVGLAILGEGVSAFGLVAILIGLGGVLALTDMPGMQGNWLKRLWNRAAGLGLASGAIFAISSVTYRGASLEVASDFPFERALVTLAAVVTTQALGMALWLLWWDRAQIGKVLRAWRTAGWIGLTSMFGSMCWFTAFTLQNAALVKAVGQVELMFSLLASVLFFRETISGREWIGIGLLSVSVLSFVLHL